MEKSGIHQKLEGGIRGIIEGGYGFNGDNHDHINIGLGLLNAESAHKLATSLKELQGQISGMTYAVTTALEQQAEKIIKSDERLIKSNEKSAFWNMILAGALILTTLVVGLLQAYVISHTN